MKIGILGGTFNPIHYGHLRAAQEIQDIFTFDKILFIPAGMPPFKKKELINARSRYEMTKIAIQNNPYFDISDIEMKKHAVSYSIETIKRLTLFFILGIDAVLDLPKWKQPQQLLTLTNLIVISRPGFSFVDLCSTPYFADVKKKTLREIDRGDKTGFSFELDTDRKAYLCKISGLEISASRIRALIKEGKSTKYLLPDSVESYIISHKLYSQK
jgi:nicotinate-nucleotide adenylyltransferase